MPATLERTPTEWLKRYFLEHPHASVDTAARDANSDRVPCHKSEIARVRRDVRAVIAKHSGMTFGPDRPTKPCRVPFNPPRIKLHKDEEDTDLEVGAPSDRLAVGHGVMDVGGNSDHVNDTPKTDGDITVPSSSFDVVKPNSDTAGMTVPETPAVSAEPVAAPPKEAKPTTKRTKRSTTRSAENKMAKKAKGDPKAAQKLAVFKKSTDKKVKWAAEQAEAHPEETTLVLNRKIAKKFGLGFPMPVLGDITRTARMALGIKVKPLRKAAARKPATSKLAVKHASKVTRGAKQGKNPVAGEIKSLAKAALDNRLYGIVTISQDGSYEFDLKPSVVIESYSGQGVA